MTNTSFTMYLKLVYYKGNCFVYAIWESGDQGYLDIVIGIGTESEAPCWGLSCPTAQSTYFNESLLEEIRYRNGVQRALCFSAFIVSSCLCNRNSCQMLDICQFYHAYSDLQRVTRPLQQLRLDTSWIVMSLCPSNQFYASQCFSNLNFHLWEKYRVLRRPISQSCGEMVCQHFAFARIHLGLSFTRQSVISSNTDENVFTAIDPSFHHFSFEGFWQIFLELLDILVLYFSLCCFPVVT